MRPLSSTKAIEAKVNYDQKLDTVQDACKKAHEAINEYNDLIGGNSKFAPTSISISFRRISTVRKRCGGHGEVSGGLQQLGAERTTAYQ